MKKYEIFISSDGKKWRHVVTFNEGDDSRFGKPFDDRVALDEYDSFKAARVGTRSEIGIIRRTRLVITD